MNRRLSAIAALVHDGRGIIDVGTDHGYLPAFLAENGYSGLIFASDIKEGPLNAARRTAAASDQTGRIRFLLCDGLALCPPDEIDTIVIAGMGGDMIVKILDNAEWCLDRRYRLILQPMTKAEVLRYWLVNNGFGIETENLVEDAETIYQIITASFGGNTRLNDAELFIGKESLNQDKALYRRQLETLLIRFDHALAGMRGREEEARCQLWQIIQMQLQEMRNQI